MAYGAREHKQRKRNPIEKKSHNNTLISNSVNYNLKKKKKGLVSALGNIYNSE